jgi:glycosyltransferase involved in cell wall biosynthesis
MTGMRILHVITNLDPGSGGPPVVANYLSAAQAALGHHVQILVGADGADPGADATALRADGVPRVSVSLSGGTIGLLLRGMASTSVADLVDQFDVLHLHGVWDPLLFVAARQARKAKKPYVVAPHGMLDPWSLAQKKWKKKAAMVFGYRRFLNGAAFLHVLNATERDLLLQLGLRTQPVVIPNGIDIRELDQFAERGKFIPLWPALANKRYILFLSRLHYKKGLDFLADAFALLAPRLPDVDLVVAGPDQGAQADFVKQVQRLGVESRVHLVGPLYGARKYQAVADAACFCLPSRQEGFSMAITEAMACSVPVVISHECHFPEVSEVQAGVETALESREIADALTRILQDDTLARQMGTNGCELVRSRYTWEKIAALSVDAYARHAGIT